jgi:dCMP deaminase
MQSSKFREVGLGYARTAATFSKDPSTKVGAAILRPDGSLVSAGWNGLAPGVQDSAERLNQRELKYALTLHAELNAILSAREALTGYTLFTYPFPPCAHCASVIIKSGISQVFSFLEESIPPRWSENFSLASCIFAEAKVDFTMTRAS